MASLSLGTLDVPEGWEVSVEATARAPAKTEAPAMLAGRASTVAEGPRPSLILQRRPAPKDADSFLEGFLEATVGASRGMKLSSAGELVFDDEVTARVHRVDLDSSPPVAQLHLCRVDDGVLTHFVLAASANEADALEELRRVVATWRAA